MYENGARSKQSNIPKAKLLESGASMRATELRFANLLGGSFAIISFFRLHSVYFRGFVCEHVSICALCTLYYVL